MIKLKEDEDRRRKEEESNAYFVQDPGTSNTIGQKQGPQQKIPHSDKGNNIRNPPPKEDQWQVQ